MTALKFVSWQVPEYNTLKGEPIYELREKLNAGGTLTNEDKDVLYNYHGRTGTFCDLRGWRIPFDDVLKAYYLEQYGSTAISYAPDKSTIRRNAHGRITKICERV